MNDEEKYWVDESKSQLSKLEEIVEELYPFCDTQDMVFSLLSVGSRNLHDLACQRNIDSYTRELWREASVLVGEINTPWWKEEGDPEKCYRYKKGPPSGDCETKYLPNNLCATCKRRDVDLIRDPDSEYYVPPMERRKNKGEW